MSKIIDTNVNTTAHLPALQAAGVQTIIRYFNRLNPHGEKTVKIAEAQAIQQAGMRLGIVYEGQGDKPDTFSESTGYADARWARFYAATELKMPASAALYFAVDFDASDEQIEYGIVPYFCGVRNAMQEQQTYPAYRIGVYGSGAVCAAITKAGLAELIWLSCSSGWRFTHDLHEQGHWHLLQHVPQQIGGIDTDPNDANGEFGDFGPLAPAGEHPVTTTYPVPESISLKCLNGVRSNEGRALRAYQDLKGVWTVGYGLTNYDKGLPWKVEKGLTITEEQAEWFLLKSLKVNYEPDVRRAIDLTKVEHPQGALDAGLDFHFNTGGIMRASWPKLLNAGNRAAAKQTLMSWNKAAGKVVAGLTRRRKWDCDALDENYGAVSGPDVIEPGADNREVMHGHGDLLTAFPHAPDDRSGGNVKVDGPPPPPKTYPPGMLRRGSHGDAVSELQTDLGVPVTGTFDEATENAVLKFQREHPDLTADGIVGPATRAAIGRASQMRSKAGTVAKTAGPLLPGIYIVLHEWFNVHFANIIGMLGIVIVVGALGYIGLRYRNDLRAAFNKWRGYSTP